ncbi:unnamed protein product [Caenorhabditis brenneri]
MNSWITILDANYIRNDTYKNEPAHYNDNAKIQFLNAYSLIVVFISNALFIVLIMYNQFWCDSEANVLCETESQNLLLLIHHTNFLVMTLITGYLHYHIYNLLERLSPENRTSRSRFLYQFLPIYAVQLAHSAAYFTATVIFKVWKVNFVKKVSFVSFIIAAPGISIIVSVSYIISEENVRTTVFTIMYPVWRELIS